MEEIINNDFIIFAYKEKYNLPLNDERYLRLSEIEMDFDLRISKKLKDIVKKVLSESDFNDEEFEEFDESFFDKENAKAKFDSGFTNEEIEDFWNKELE